MSAASSRDLDDILDQIPALAGRPRVVEDLPGGLTNRNVKVTTPAGRFVARISGSNASALGIDRDVEHYNTRAAERAGAGAPVVDYRPDLGVLVIGYLDGRTLTNADLADSELAEEAVLGRIAQACLRLHRGPRFRGEFNMFDRQRGYLATVTKNNFRVPTDYRSHESSLERIQRALDVRAEATVPCNNDLLAGNFVDDGTRTWLIDYEYAGNNDAYFELGNLAGECALDLEQLTWLVTAYDGAERPAHVARARLQQIVGQYGWTLWGCIQHATSPLDFDFWEWATERYDKAVAAMSGPDFEWLLEQAAGPR